MKTWPEKIAALESAGWALSALGREIGLSPQSLSDIKHLRTKEPTGMAAVRLHEMFVRKAKPAKPAKSKAKAA